MSRNHLGYFYSFFVNYDCYFLLLFLVVSQFLICCCSVPPREFVYFHPETFLYPHLFFA